MHRSHLRIIAGAFATALLLASPLFAQQTKDEITDPLKRDLVKRGVLSAFHVLAGITHYGVCAEATRVEVEWFDKHLKK